MSNDTQTSASAADQGAAFDPMWDTSAPAEIPAGVGDSAETDGAPVEGADPPATKQERGADGRFKAKERAAEDDESSSEGGDEAEPEAPESQEAKGEDEPQDKPGELPIGVRKRLDRERAARTDAETRAEEAERRARDMEAKLAARDKADALDPDEFDSFADYQDARKKILDAKPEPSTDSGADDDGKMIDGVPEAAFKTAFKAVSEDIEDADPALWDRIQEMGNDLRFSAGMVAALANEPDPVGVTRYLVENPKESERLASMTPARAANAITRLGMRIEMGAVPKTAAKSDALPPKKGTKAPAPIEPVGSRHTSPRGSHEASDFAEFEAARERESGSGGDWL